MKPKNLAYLGILMVCAVGAWMYRAASGDRYDIWRVARTAIKTLRLIRTAQHEHHQATGAYATLDDLKFIRNEEIVYRVPSLDKGEGSVDFGWRYSMIELPMESRFSFQAVYQFLDHGDSMPTLIVSQAGGIFYKDTGGEAVSRWPANPSEEGWCQVDKNMSIYRLCLSTDFIAPK